MAGGTAESRGDGGRYLPEETGRDYPERCTYSGCKRPDESGRFRKIEGNEDVGAQDWSSVAGEVLCKACYQHYGKHGRLARRAIPERNGEPPSRCTYAGCKRPEESRQFYEIKGTEKGGGRDWNVIAGEVLCGACYAYFGTYGRLERKEVPERPEDYVRRCTYAACKRPDESRKFYEIKGTEKAFGQDWSSVANEMLCSACYQHYGTYGRLERREIPERSEDVARKCTYSLCKRPDESGRFHEIKGSEKGGGHDWSSIAGEVLCNACYTYFGTHGRLERREIPVMSSGDGDRRCTYMGCKRPNESWKFLEITGNEERGGQDWGRIAGETLCYACYQHYGATGTLERMQQGKRRSSKDPVPMQTKRVKREGGSDKPKSKGGAAHGDEDLEAAQILAGFSFTGADGGKNRQPPVAQGPVAQAPVMQAPVAHVAQAPVVQAPVAQVPVGQVPIGV